MPAVHDFDLPRGIRNNNPGNLKHSSQNQWIGLASPAQDAKGFCVFDDPVMGIRALVKTIHTYFYRRKAADGSAIDTIPEIIARYAPVGSENPHHEEYIDFVTARFRRDCPDVDIETGLDMEDYDQVQSICRSICFFENGMDPYADAIWHRGIIHASIIPKQEPKDRAMGATKVAGTAAVATPLLPALLPSLENILPYQPFLTRAIELAPWVIGVITVAAVGWVGVHLWRERRYGLR